ncbi:MAG: hypothetical protein U1A27_00360 [Phycisphaerae bacterium]
MSSPRTHPGADLAGLSTPALAQMEWSNTLGGNPQLALAVAGIASSDFDWRDASRVSGVAATRWDVQRLASMRNAQPTPSSNVPDALATDLTPASANEIKLAGSLRFKDGSVGDSLESWQRTVNRLETVIQPVAAMVLVTDIQDRH